MCVLWGSVRERILIYDGAFFLFTEERDLENCRENTQTNFLVLNMTENKKIDYLVINLILVSFSFCFFFFFLYSPSMSFFHWKHQSHILDPWRVVKSHHIFFVGNCSTNRIRIREFKNHFKNFSFFKFHFSFSGYLFSFLLVFEVREKKRNVKHERAGQFNDDETHTKFRIISNQKHKNHDENAINFNFFCVFLRWNRLKMIWL